MKQLFAALCLLSLPCFSQTSTYSDLSANTVIVTDSIPGTSSYNDLKDISEYAGNLYVLVVTNTNVAVFSYKKDGTLNTNFAAKGKFIKVYGYSPIEPRMTIDNDGNIYIATYNGVLVEVIKVNQAGKVVTNFAGSGLFSFTTAAAGTLIDMKFNNNNLVIAGYNGLSIFVLKLTISGSLNTNFDGDGYALLSYVNDSPYLYGMAFDDQDRIYLTGYISYFATGISQVIVRFHTSGVDTGFGLGGVVNTTSTGYYRGCRIIGNRLYVCGYKTVLGYAQGMLTAHELDGTLITSFGENGDTLIGNSSHYEYFHDLIQLQNGTLLAAGYRMNMPSYNNDSYFGNFTTDGIPVSSFGNNGELNVSTTPDYEKINVLRSSRTQIMAGGSKANKFMLVITNVHPLDGTPDFPTGFSPNNDGKNDHLEIFDIDYALNNKLVVYDREGNKVYEARNYQNDWDGTSGGKPLPDGVYYYFFEYQDNDPIKNFIEIRRK